MSSSDSEFDRLQAMAEIIPDYLRRILPLARPSQDVPQHTTLHATADCASSTPATLSHPPGSTTESVEAREEAAEDLCDLVASASYAQIAVRCMAYQMLAVVAMEALDTRQHRLAELCMAALANLTCHEKLAEQVTATTSNLFIHIVRHA